MFFPVTMISCVCYIAYAAVSLVIISPKSPASPKKRFGTVVTAITPYHKDKHTVIF